MPDYPEVNKVISNFRPIAQNRFSAFLGMFVVAGLSALLYGLFSYHPQAVYQALLVNTLFFFGLSHGSLMVSAILTLTHAKWGRAIKRLAESTALFIPISWILFGILLTGMDHLFLWLDPHYMIPEKSWWLNRPFFFVRNFILLIGTGMAGAAYVASSLLPDLVYLKKVSPDSLSEFALKLVKDSPHTQETTDTKQQTRFAVWYVALFIVSSCLLAFDWMMSLDQKWISTAFGFQYTVAGLYTGCAFLVIGFVLARRNEPLIPYYSLNRLNDLSRLLFVSCLVWTYLVFSQILVIWYANLPEETPYLLLRMENARWDWMFNFLFVSLFIVPFIGLLTKRACRSPFISCSVAVICLIGLWTEKFFLTVPSIEQHSVQSPGEPTAYLGILDLTITLGFAAGFLLCVIKFLRTFPILPVSDPLLSKDQPLESLL